jgi:hypothetical protein
MHEGNNPVEPQRIERVRKYGPDGFGGKSLLPVGAAKLIADADVVAVSGFCRIEDSPELAQFNPTNFDASLIVAVVIGFDNPLWKCR